MPQHGGVSFGGRLVADADGFAGVTAGADAFAIAPERGPPRWFIVVRFLATPPDEDDDED